MSNSVIVRSLIAFTFYIIASQNISAQTPGVQRTDPEESFGHIGLDTIQIKEVVVTGFHEATSHQVISQQQISAIPNSSVADALKYMAGVQIKDYGGLGGQKTINVRAMGTQHIGVYLDGVRITNAQNSTVDLGKFSLNTLESVSVYNANKTEKLMMASEYASAATVYLKTKRPDKTSFAGSYQLASFGTHKLNATFSYKKYLLLDAAFNRTKGDYPYRYVSEYEDTTGVRRNSDFTMFRVEATGFYKQFQLHAYYYSSIRGIPGGIVRRLSDKYSDVGREWDRNFFTQLSYQNQFGDFGVRGILKYSNDWLHYRSDYPENMSVHTNNKYHQQDIYGAVSGSYRYRDFGVSVSTDLRWSDLVTDVKNMSYVYRIDSKTSLALFYSLQGLKLSLGGLYTNITDHSGSTSKKLTKFTWNALASYTLGNWMFRAFYKSIFRAPTLNDLYYTLVGNANLKPEYAKQLDVGITYAKYFTSETSINVQADFYYNRIIDRIVCIPTKASYRWSMQNFGKTRCLGVDVSVNGRYKQHSLLVSASFQDDRNRTDPASSAYDNLVPYSPQWSVSAVYSFSYKGIMASLSHMFVGKRYWTRENSLEAPLSAYNCTDLKVGYTFLKHFTAEAECQNLFNTRFELLQRWPMPGRMFALTLKYKM